VPLHYAARCIALTSSVSLPCRISRLRVRVVIAMAGDKRKGKEKVVTPRFSRANKTHIISVV